MKIVKVVNQSGLEVILYLVDSDLVTDCVSQVPASEFGACSVPNVGDLDICVVLFRLIDCLVDLLIVCDSSTEVFGCQLGILPAHR